MDHYNFFIAMKTSWAILCDDGNKWFGYGVLKFYFAMPTFLYLTLLPVKYSA